MTFTIEIHAQNFTYKDNFGNKCVYDYNKKSIPSKLDTILGTLSFKSLAKGYLR